jgi:hypothetical protein
VQILDRETGGFVNSLILAIAKTAEEIQPLAKTQFNPHAKYKYVGIDDFYAVVAPIARANGLIWTISETAPPDIIPGDKHPILVFHYVVTLFIADGGVGARDDSLGQPEHVAMNISIPHPWQGPQTAGSASSYAIKTVLRAVFSVQTGEADADATDQSFAPSPTGAKSEGPFAVTGKAPVPVGAVTSPSASTPPAAGPPAAAGVRGDVTMGEMEPIFKGWFDGNLPVLLDPKGDQSYPWDLARDILMQNVKYVGPAEKVSAWWRENIAVMDQMKEYDPDSHKAVVKAFEDRRHTLIKESKEKQK